MQLKTSNMAIMPMRVIYQSGFFYENDVKNVLFDNTKQFFNVLIFEFSTAGKASFQAD